MPVSRISRGTVNFNYPIYKKEIEHLNNTTFNVVFNGFGYTSNLSKLERFRESVVDNTIIDTGNDSIRFTKGLVERFSDEAITLYDAPFSGEDDELLDYSVNGTTTQANHKSGDIVHCGNGQGIQEKTYQAITSTTSGDSVADVTKFKELDFVSRQDVVFIGKDGKYKTIKGYINFQAGFSVDDVATAYGWTKKGNGLFYVSSIECKNTDGTVLNYSGEITAISLVSRLNAKMYDLVHNPFGSRKDSDAKLWYETENDSTYTALNTDTSSQSGRSDLRLESKVYVEGIGGLIFRNTQSLIPNKKDILADSFNELIGKSASNEECGVVTTVLPVAPFKTQLEYLEDGTMVKHNQFLQQGMLNVNDIAGNPAIYVSADSPAELHSDSSDSGTLLRQGALCWDADNSLMYVYLDTDDRDNVDMTTENLNDTAKYRYVIGRYANSWYNRVLNGNILPFSMLLIGQDGTDYIPADDSYDRILSKKSIQDITNILYTKPRQVGVFSVYEKSLGSIENNITGTQSLNSVSVIPYTALPQTTNETDTKTLLMVEDKVIISNSNDLNKGSGIVNAVSGKVSTSAKAKQVRISNVLNTAITSGEFTAYPEHDVAELDIDKSPAAKAITGLYIDTNGELLIGLIGEEMINDYDGGNTNIHIDSTVDDDVTLYNGENYEFFFETEDDSKDGSMYKFSGLIMKYKGAEQTFNRSDISNVVVSYDDGSTGTVSGITVTSDGRLVNESSGALCTDWEIWSGNGFGDDGMFSQMINGDKIDTNGNTVRTYFGIKRTGFYA